MTTRKPHHHVTPDGRYCVVHGRLWRMSDPALPPDRRDRLVKELMAAHGKVGTARRAGDEEAEAAALDAIDRAKRALGERGPVRRHDGAPDLNRHMARNTTYAEWQANQCSSEEGNAQRAGQTPQMK